MKFIPLNALCAQITVKWEWKKLRLCARYLFIESEKNVMCPDQMFVESIHLERSVSTICAVKMKWEKCVAKMNHLKNVWCILHVICNIKPSNIWHGYGCAINRNCKCLHWIKSELKPISSSILYLPFWLLFLCVGLFRRKWVFCIQHKELQILLHSNHIIWCSKHAHILQHSCIFRCQRWHKRNYLICIPCHEM